MQLQASRDCPANVWVATPGTDGNCAAAHVLCSLAQPLSRAAGYAAAGTILRAVSNDQCSSLGPNPPCHDTVVVGVLKGGHILVSTKSARTVTCSVRESVSSHRDVDHSVAAMHRQALRRVELVPGGAVSQLRRAETHSGGGGRSHKQRKQNVYGGRKGAVVVAPGAAWVDRRAAGSACRIDKSDDHVVGVAAVRESCQLLIELGSVKG